MTRRARLTFFAAAVLFCAGVWGIVLYGLIWAA